MVLPWRARKVFPANGYNRFAQGNAERNVQFQTA